MLRDGAGVTVRLPSTVVGLTRVYRLLGDRDVVGDTVEFDDELTDHIDRHRPKGRPSVRRHPADPCPGEGLDDAPLPPRPDPWTGLPAPPPGPDLGRYRSGNAGDRRRAAQDVDAAPAPRPPGGRGPALSWRRRRLRRRAVPAVVLAAILLTGFAVTRGPGWTADPAGWLLLAVCTAPLAVIARRRDLAAGADWVRRGRRWVDLRALAGIRVTRHDHLGLAVHLTDTHQRWLRLEAHELAEAPAVWALVHAEMRHGAATGTQLSGDGLHELGLGRPSPSMRPAVPPYRGAGRRILGVLLMTVSVGATVLFLSLAGNGAWFGVEGLDYALALALCVVVQLSVCSVAVGVGNVAMEGGLGAVAAVVVLAGLLFGPFALATGLLPDRGDAAAVIGLAAGAALIAVVVRVAHDRARIRFLLGRVLDRCRRA